MAKKPTQLISESSMPRFALIDTTNNSLIELRSYPTQPPNPPGKARKFLPAPPVAPPTVNPLTETMGAPTYTVGGSSVTEVWTKRSLTAPELVAAKDAEAAGLGGGTNSREALLKILLLIVNDLRTIKAKCNAIIATGGSTPPFAAGAVAQIDMAQLKTLIRNQLDP